MTAQHAKSDDWRAIPAMIMMLASHEAFRRDLDDFRRFTAARKKPSNDMRRGWNDFTLLLHNHHRAEDEFLWPIARKAIEPDTEQATSLDRMQEQHHDLEPLLMQVEQAWDDLTQTATSLEQLQVKLVDHLRNEESLVLPWVAPAMSERDWRQYQKESRDTTNKKLPFIFLPWISYQRSDRRGEGVNAVIPAPMGLVVRTLLLPRYEKRQGWRRL
jgi:hemerythrin-like domain-containing protein